MNKIIILARISTAPQNIESQTNDLIKEAVHLGYDEKHQIIIETIESATKLSEEERLGLRKMKHYIETDKDVDCVICWEPSRLARQQKILFSIRDYLIANKIQLYILNPYVKLLNDDRTQIDPTANIVFSLFATISENEMMIKKERFMREKNKLTMEGKKAAGAVIFGYMKDKDKKCVPHPLHSKIIVDIYNHYVNEQDASCYETYKYISNKYPELFKPLEYKKAQRKMQYFLSKSLYADGNWCYQPIISKDIFEAARKKTELATCRPRYKCKRQLLSRGKLYCGHCGKMMTGSGGNVKAYCCSTDKLHNIQINIDAMDWLMWEETHEIVNLNAALDNNTKINEFNEKIKYKRIEQNQIAKMISELDEKENKILDLYLENKINKTTLDKRIDDIHYEKEKYNSELNSLNIEINELQTTLDNTQKDVLKYNSINADSITNFETRLELVRQYIDKVIVTKKGLYTYLEFFYKSGIYIVQHGLYKYRNMGGWKKIIRINADETEDVILYKKKIG